MLSYAQSRGGDNSFAGVKRRRERSTSRSRSPPSSASGNLRYSSSSKKHHSPASEKARQRRRTLEQNQEDLTSEQCESFRFGGRHLLSFSDFILTESAKVQKEIATDTISLGIRRLPRTCPPEVLYPNYFDAALGYTSIDKALLDAPQFSHAAVRVAPLTSSHLFPSSSELQSENLPQALRGDVPETETAGGSGLSALVSAWHSYVRYIRSYRRRNAKRFFESFKDQEWILNRYSFSSTGTGKKLAATATSSATDVSSADPAGSGAAERGSEGSLTSKGAVASVSSVTSSVVMSGNPNNHAQRTETGDASTSAASHGAATSVYSVAPPTDWFRNYRDWQTRVREASAFSTGLFLKADSDPSSLSNSYGANVRFPGNWLIARRVPALVPRAVLVALFGRATGFAALYMAPPDCLDEYRRFVLVRLRSQANCESAFADMNKSKQIWGLLDLVSLHDVPELSSAGLWSAQSSSSINNNNSVPKLVCLMGPHQRAIGLAPHESISDAARVAKDLDACLQLIHVLDLKRGLDPFNANATQPKVVQLNMALAYLRLVHMYCYYSGRQYRTIDDMLTLSGETYLRQCNSNAEEARDRKSSSLFCAAAEQCAIAFVRRLEAGGFDEPDRADTVAKAAAMHATASRTFAVEHSSIVNVKGRGVRKCLLCKKGFETIDFLLAHMVAMHAEQLISVRNDSQKAAYFIQYMHDPFSPTFSLSENFDAEASAEADSHGNKVAAAIVSARVSNYKERANRTAKNLTSVYVWVDREGKALPPTNKKEQVRKSGKTKTPEVEKKQIRLVPPPPSEASKALESRQLCSYADLLSLPIVPALVVTQSS